MAEELIGWWFAAGDTLPHGDGRKVVIGETLTVEPPIVPCERGLHASLCPFDALQYAPGPLLYRVRLSGIIKHESDKVAASERTTLAAADATDTLRLFARKMALSVVHLWDAPAVVREYLETGDESKRAAARDAAWAAAEAATWAAAEAATRAATWAATRAATWAATSAATSAAASADASAAAWDATTAATWAAAEAATRAATWAAAEAAASAAATAAARTLFAELIGTLFDG